MLGADGSDRMQRSGAEVRASPVDCGEERMAGCHDGKVTSEISPFDRRGRLQEGRHND